VTRPQTAPPRELPRTASASTPRTGTGNQPRTGFDQRFATVEEATKGVPEEVIRARRLSKSCLRCGLTGHQATHCARQLDTRMPKEGRIAGLKRGEDGVDGEEYEEEDGVERESKRSRFEVAALDAQEVPLYEG
jgi:hypothetical protein